MNPADAAAVVALRPAVENMISQATENPEGFFPLNPENEKLVKIVIDLSRLEAAKFGEELQGVGSGEGSYGGGRAGRYEGHQDYNSGRFQGQEMQGGDESFEEDGGSVYSQDQDYGCVVFWFSVFHVIVE